MKEKNTSEGYDLLGKEVQVIVDRPINSPHPEHGFIYELNYGFIPNTLAGDGEELDAYVIGVEEPLNQFTGIVKAIIIRLDDNENKLIVTKPDKVVTENEIREKTRFQEQFF